MFILLMKHHDKVVEIKLYHILHTCEILVYHPIYHAACRDKRAIHMIKPFIVSF